MGTLLDLASLVVVPSGYKEDKIYSVVPTDGSGDLDFTRASNATRVNSAGLIEKVRTNLFLQSNTFSNIDWFKSNATLTSGESDPFGGLNAWKMEAILTLQTDIRQTVSGAAGYSIYAKAGNYNFFSLWTGTTGIAFNLTAGTAGAGGTITNVGNGWYRCSVATSTTGTVTLIPFFSANAGDFVYIAFAQAEPTDVATDYIPTTTAAVSVGMTADVPRLDYLGSSCPSLLLEPQRTNLVTFSEQMNFWANGSGTMTANQLASPDGAVNADKFDNSGDCSTFVTAANAAHTFSLFVKQGTSPSASIDMSDGATGDVITTFTFATKSFSNTTAGGSWTSPSTAYQDYGNGWYRISLTATKGAGSTIGHKIIASGSGYTYVWGAQLEAGSYVTSYIPSLSTSVTRVADAASKTGIGSLIGQTEGTVFLEVDYSTLSGLDMFLSIRPNASNKVEVYRDGAIIFGEITASSSFAISLTKAVGTHKIAFAYKSGSSALYIDGALAAQSTTAFTFSATLADLFLNQRNANLFVEAANYKQVLLFKTRLSNTELAQITSL
jgi:hypothetical protein